MFHLRFPRTNTQRAGELCPNQSKVFADSVHKTETMSTQCRLFNCKHKPSTFYASLCTSFGCCDLIGSHYACCKSFVRVCDAYDSGSSALSVKWKNDKSRRRRRRHQQRNSFVLNALIRFGWARFGSVQFSSVGCWFSFVSVFIGGLDVALEIRQLDYKIKYLIYLAT